MQQQGHRTLRVRAANSANSWMSFSDAAEPRVTISSRWRPNSSHTTHRRSMGSAHRVSRMWASSETASSILRQALERTFSASASMPMRLRDAARPCESPAGRSGWKPLSAMTMPCALNSVF
jgi:hypothetical protein